MNRNSNHLYSSQNNKGKFGIRVRSVSALIVSTLKANSVTPLSASQKLEPDLSPLPRH